MPTAAKSSNSPNVALLALGLTALATSLVLGRSWLESASPKLGPSGGNGGLERAEGALDSPGLPGRDLTASNGLASSRSGHQRDTNASTNPGQAGSPDTASAATGSGASGMAADPLGSAEATRLASLTRASRRAAAQARETAGGIQAGAVSGSKGDLSAEGSDRKDKASGSAGSEAKIAGGGPPVRYDSGIEESFGTETGRQSEPLQVNANSGSVSFWLQPGWDGANQQDAELANLGDTLRVSKNVNFLRFEYLDELGKSGGLGFPIGDWKPGEWHQVTGTWRGNNMTLYVDGQAVSSGILGKVSFPEETRLRVGTSAGGAAAAPGLLHNVQVLGGALNPIQVQERFVSTQPPSKSR